MKYEISVISKQENRKINWAAYLKYLNDYEEPKKQTLWDKIRDFLNKVIRSIIMRKKNNEAKNRKLKEYWDDESRREVARQRTLAFWRSKRGKNLKKEMRERKGKPKITNITSSQLDSSDYIKLYHRKYREARVDQNGTPYYVRLARFDNLKKKGKIDKDIRFKDYCKENGIEFHTMDIHWEKGDN